MKLKYIKLFENLVLEELEEEVKKLSEGSLSFLFDKGFDAYITNVESNILIELSKYDKIDEDTVDRLQYNWDEIKEEFIPFIEILNEKYSIQEIMFYEDAENDWAVDEYDIDDILNIDFNQNIIESIQIILKNK